MIRNFYIQPYISGVFTRFDARQRNQLALERAYTIFAGQYPEWRETLFDLHFLTTRVAPLLTANADATPQAIAEAWAAQFGLVTVQQRMAETALPIATAFLALWRAELGGVNTGRSRLKRGS